LEAAAGLPTPHQAPEATTSTLIYRVLAAIASTAIKSVHPFEIQSGFVDTAGYGGGQNEALDSFSAILEELRCPRENDFWPARLPLLVVARTILT
jgi:hypothetical protein